MTGTAVHTEETKNIGVSFPKTVLVCIITFRREESLRRLLQALAAQRCDGLAFSLMVVDNDPAGSAAAVCRWAETLLASRVLYRCESEPGIVAARNRGVREFLAGDIDAMAFIDDDEWPQRPDWLERMALVMREQHADIVAGDVLSVAAPGTPAWATRILYEPSLRDDGEPVAMFYTGNVLIARPVLETITPAFDPRFALTGASDYHFALRCVRAGFRAVFADAPVIEEFPADRATTGWFVRRGFRSGAGYSRSQLFEGKSLAVVPKCLGLAALRVARGLLVMVGGALSLNRARVIKGLFRMAAGVGTLAGLAGISHQEYGTLHR